MSDLRETGTSPAQFRCRRTGLLLVHAALSTSTGGALIAPRAAT